ECQKQESRYEFLPETENYPSQHPRHISYGMRLGIVPYSQYNDQIGRKAKSKGPKKCQFVIYLKNQQQNIQPNEVQEQVICGPWKKTERMVEIIYIIMRIMSPQLICSHPPKCSIGPVRLLPCLLPEFCLLPGHSNILDNVTLEDLLPLKD